MSWKRLAGLSMNIYGGTALACASYTCMFYLITPGEKSAHGFVTAANDGLLLPWLCASRGVSLAFRTMTYEDVHECERCGGPSERE